MLAKLRTCECNHYVRMWKRVDFKMISKEWKNVAKRSNSSQSFGSSDVAGHSCLRFVGESITRSLQAQIVNALWLGDRSRASTLLSDLGHCKNSLGADDFLYILDYCARSPDPLFALETWKIMEDTHIGMSERCCMFIIRSLSKGGYLQEAFDWLNYVEENHRMYPILPMYNSFLNGCVQMKSMIHANNCLDLMEGQLMGKSEVTYWELLKLAVWQKNLSAVHDIWKECSTFYSPSIVSLRKFIWSFTRLSDLVSAYETLQQMVALAFGGTAFIKRFAETKFPCSRLDIPIPTNCEFAIMRFGIEENGRGVPCSLTEGCKVKKEKDDGTYSHIGISSWQNHEICGIDKDVNRSLVEAENDCRNLLPFHMAHEENATALALGSTEDKRGAFEMLKRDGTMPIMRLLRWSFNDVILACAKARNCELAEKLFLQMRNLGLEPSSYTYDAVIRALVSIRGVTDGMKMLKIMQKRNLKPYDATLANLSIGCSKMLDLDLAEALLDQIVENPQIHPYNAFLAACDAMDQPECAIRVLAKMKQLKLKSDIRTYELLFSLFGYVNAPYEEGTMLSQVDAAKRIKAIERDMVKNGVHHSHLSMKNLLNALGAEGMIGELIHYLSVAENLFYHKKTYPGTSIYNTVLHSLVESRESQTAMEVFKYMNLFGLQPDASTYNIMIDCCSITRCFKSACVLVAIMLRDGFHPQICTYTSLLKILVANEDFNEALNILDLASSDGIQPDTQLFNTILQEASYKGQIDIIEFIVERMHQEKIQPDPSTCRYVFYAYVNSGFTETAMEALLVLSMRMISDEQNFLQEKRSEFEEAYIYAEDLQAESRIINLFEDSEVNLAAALLNLRWCAIVGLSLSWLPNQSSWATRLSAKYSARRTI